MNFIEAVEEMRKGKKVRRKYWINDKFYTKYDNCKFISPISEVYYFTIYDIKAIDWEVVDEDKDWNLADEIEHRSKYDIQPVSYNDVKKCRDLIIEDFEKQRPITDFKVIEVLSIINKRFGDLE